MNDTPATGLLHLRAELEDIEPPIWRTLRVPASIRLDRLHRVLQVAFGWEDCHLHCFEARGVSYATPHPDDWTRARDERKEILGSLLPVTRSSMLYTYDFGDNWRVKLRLLERPAGEEGAPRVTCTGGERAAPPEDSGGVGGYYDLLDALADPDGDEGLREWMGEWRPEHFDAAEINARLKRLRV